MINWLFTQTPLAFFVRTLWRDEAFSVLLAQKSIPEIITLTAGDFSPPLYYLLLHMWTGVFGTGGVALRTLSFVFFMGMCYMTFLIYNEVLKIKERPALFYTFLTAANPLLLYYAFEVRMYSMAGFLAAVSFYAYAKRKTGLHLWIILAGVFTHYFMIFVPIVQAAHLLIFERDSTTAKKFFRNIVLTGILFASWIAFFWFSNKEASEQFWLNRKPVFSLLPAFLYTGFDIHIGFWKEFFRPLSAYLCLLIGLGMIEARRLPQQTQRTLTLLILWAGLPTLTIFFLSFYKPLFLDRYLLFATVGYTVLISFLLHILSRPAKLVLATVLLLFIYGLNVIQIKEKQHADSRKVFTQIKQLADAQDVVYVTNELYFHEAQYYFDKNRVFIYGKSYDEIPAYVGKVIMPRERFVNILPTFPSKAFVVDGNLNYSIQTQF